MYRTLVFILSAFILSIFLCGSAIAGTSNDTQSIERAVLDYIESQHRVEPSLMERGLDKKLAKRTYWEAKDGTEFIMETDFDTMVYVAENYNKEGDKFAANPKVKITILDIDNRVASVKLSVDDWIDYMHLYKNASNQWKIINVLWQFHDERKHTDKKSAKQG
jgi:hypothetical protein